MDFVKPDFVVVGTTYSDGKVVLLASKTLDYAELKQEIEYPDIFNRRARQDMREDIHIIAKIKDYIWVRADSYAEAWRILFDQWSPSQADREYMTLEEFKQWELE